MSICQIKLKKKNDKIENVYNKQGKESILYPVILSYISKNDIYKRIPDYFNILLSKGKIKSLDNDQLALGVYSILYDSNKSETYWVDKYETVFNKIESYFTKDNTLTDNVTYQNTIKQENEDVVFDNIKELVKTNYNNYVDAIDDFDFLTNEESEIVEELLSNNIYEINCK